MTVHVARSWDTFFYHKPILVPGIFFADPFLTKNLACYGRGSSFRLKYFLNDGAP